MIWQAWAGLVVLVLFVVLPAFIVAAIVLVELIRWCRAPERRAARLVRWTERVVSTCPQCQARWLHARRLPLALFHGWCRFRRHVPSATASSVETVPP